MNSQDLKQFTEQATEKALQSLWVNVHEFAETTTGDETPEMALRYEAIKKEIVEAIIQQVEFNL